MDLQSKLDMTFGYEAIPYGAFKTEEEKIANGKMGGQFVSAIRTKRWKTLCIGFSV